MLKGKIKKLSILNMDLMLMLFNADYVYSIEMSDNEPNYLKLKVLCIDKNYERIFIWCKDQSFTKCRSILRINYYSPEYIRNIGSFHSEQL